MRSSLSIANRITAISARNFYQFCGVAAKNRDEFGVAQSRCIEDMIDGPFYPGDCVVRSNHDLACAVFVDQVAQSFGGEDQGIEIELLQVLTRLFLQDWSFALVGKDRAAVIHPRGIGREVTAAVRCADFHVREAVERGLEDQMSKRKRRF